MTDRLLVFREVDALYKIYFILIFVLVQIYI